MCSEFCSISEAIESLALPLEGVHHVCGHHGLPLGVLRVGDGVPHHVLEEHAQHRPDLKLKFGINKRKLNYETIFYIDMVLIPEIIVNYEFLDITKR